MIEINEDLKKCSKCEMEYIKSEFHRNTKTSNEFQPQCNICRRKYYNENLVKIKKYIFRQSR